MEEFENCEEVSVVEKKGAIATTRDSEVARAIEEVRAPMVLARQFPRDVVQARKNILNTCAEYSFAEIANYSFPKGKDKRGNKTFITGPSSKLMAMIQNEWGNIESGWRSIRNEKGTGARIFCWAMDLQTNTRIIREIEIEFKIKAFGALKPIDDPVDQNRLIANHGSRHTRECVRGIIRRDITDAAEERCRKTLAGGLGDKSPADQTRVKKMIASFDSLGVTVKMLETYAACPTDEFTVANFIEFIGIYNSIKDGHTTAEEYFDIKKESRTVKSSLNESLDEVESDVVDHWKESAKL